MSQPPQHLSHLPHVEDHVLHGDFNRAHNTIAAVHAKLANRGKAKINTKYDGSPSIVFGHHPETKRFFVASKSAFNKNPKINYTQQDIERNHGHAPGLVSKLGHALRHLPKITNGHGVYQADIMHTPEDVHHDEHGSHFKPNTITYTARHGSKTADKIKKSKIGVAIHTQYHGDTFDSMHAKVGEVDDNINSPPDVHAIDQRTATRRSNYTHEDQKQVKAHLDSAKAENEKIKDKKHIHAPHGVKLETYINKTVREKTKPSHAGFVSHLEDTQKRDVASVKMEKTKAAKHAEHQVYTRKSLITSKSIKILSKACSMRITIYNEPKMY